MRVGGSCASGGSAFPIRQQCPQGIPAIMTGSVLGGLLPLGAFRGAEEAQPPGWPAGMP
jgi:hypothetical protein